MFAAKMVKWSKKVRKQWSSLVSQSELELLVCTELQISTSNWSLPNVTAGLMVIVKRLLTGLVGKNDHQNGRTISTKFYTKIYFSLLLK